MHKKVRWLDINFFLSNIPTTKHPLGRQASCFPGRFGAYAARKKIEGERGEGRKRVLLASWRGRRGYFWHYRKGAEGVLLAS